MNQDARSLARSVRWGPPHKGLQLQAPEVSGRVKKVPPLSRVCQVCPK
jgi:hypothetical protein